MKTKKEMRDLLLACQGQEEYARTLQGLQDEVFEATHRLDSQEYVWLLGVKSILDHFFSCYSRCGIHNCVLHQ